MTNNQFLTDANAYIKAITPNYKSTTMQEKSRKLRWYADIMYHLYLDGRISTSAPSKMTADDLNAYVTYRRSQGIAEPTIAKDMSIIGMFLRWKGNTAIDVYKVQYGNMKPHPYEGRHDALPNGVVEKVYALARETESWSILEGCVAVILCCSAGLRPQEARQLYAADVNLMGDRTTIHVEHVKGEGSWGHKRNVPVMDGGEVILEKYLIMREEKLRSLGRTSAAMFPPLRTGKEFLTQQAFGRLKAPIEEIIGIRFQLRDGRRAFGQRMLDSGYKLELVSRSMGHDTVVTTQKYYANFSESQVLEEIFDRKNGVRT